MQLRTLFFLTVAATSLAACGSTSPAEACAEQAKAECKKMWSCDSDLKIGEDEESCVEAYDLLCAFAEAACEGEEFNVDKAEECAKAVEAQSCEEYNSEEAPAACEATCGG